jgi:hypothetical protein
MAFATVEDIAAVTGATYTEAEAAQLEALAEMATDQLTAELGGTTVPVPPEETTVELDLRIGETSLALPGPVRSVADVLVDGASAGGWEVADGRLRWPAGCGWGPAPDRQFAQIAVTYTRGYDVVPTDLKTWCVILTLQARRWLQTTGSLSSGGVQAVRVGEWSESFSTGEAAEAFAVPPRVAARLRARYGDGGAQATRWTP